MNAEKLLVVAATRLAPNPFMEAAPLGRSLRRISHDRRLEIRPAFSNRDGLPAVYNRQISEENRDKILLFVHDDVWLDDWFVYERLQDALKVFEVVGLAGSIRRRPRQPAWAFTTETPITREEPRYLSGVIAHGEQRGDAPLSYGRAGQPCALLDGVFIAVSCRSLLDSGVRFDERFTFDFYDMDFCRSAQVANLRMGTWPIAATHSSDGKFGSTAWRAALEVYRRKWGD